MIVSLLKMNRLFKFHKKIGHLGFFGHGDPIYYTTGELIQGCILLKKT